MTNFKIPIDIFIKFSIDIYIHQIIFQNSLCISRPSVSRRTDWSTRPERLMPKAGKAFARCWTWSTKELRTWVAWKACLFRSRTALQRINFEINIHGPSCFKFHCFNVLALNYNWMTSMSLAKALAKCRALFFLAQWAVISGCLLRG